MGTIGRANLDGTGANPNFITGAGNPSGLAVDGAHLYWANNAPGGSIDHRRPGPLDIQLGELIDLGASFPTEIFMDGVGGYFGLQPAGDGRAKLVGAAATANLIPVSTSSQLEGVTSTPRTSSGPSWADRQVMAPIGRANLDGTGPNPNFITGATNPDGLAVDGSHIYWANSGSGTIGRANLDGTGVNQGFITGAASPTGWRSTPRRRQTSSASAS